MTGKLSLYHAMMIAMYWVAASVFLILLFPEEAAQSQLVLLQEMTFELPLTAFSNSNHLTGQCGQAWAVASSGILAVNLPRLHSQTQQPRQSCFNSFANMQLHEWPHQVHAYATASSCDPVISLMLSSHTRILAFMSLLDRYATSRSVAEQQPFRIICFAWHCTCGLLAASHLQDVHQQVLEQQLQAR